MTGTAPHPATDRDHGVEDRLLALVGRFGDQLGRTYDPQDADSCALRVVADLAAQERWRAAHDNRVRPAHRELLQRYHALASTDSAHRELAATVQRALSDGDGLSSADLSALLRRCLREIVGRPGAADLRREISALHASTTADVEATYRALLEPPAGSAAGPGGAPTAAEALQARLRQALTESDLRVLSADAIQGGFSKSTVVVSVDGGNLPAQLVVRADSGHDFAGTSVTAEYALLRTLWKRGVAVPRPRGLSPAPPGGHAMMVVDKLAGRPFGSPFSAVCRSAELNSQMAQHLATLHSVPIGDVSFLDDQGADQLAQLVTDVDTVRRQLDDTQLDVPVVDAALCWLAENPTSALGTRTLVHGDYGPHNLLADQGRITGILDWEFARVGNPVADLCWVRRAATALDTWPGFLEEYERAGGHPPTPEQITFFTILATAQIAVAVLRTTSVLHRDPRQGLRTAVPMAERLRPLLLDLHRSLIDA